jgi:glycosyltransferase involved in cell wall biosynthesis
MTSLPHRDATGRPRIAIVHDYFTQHGGAERVVGELVRLFPDATVHTSVFDRDKLPPPVATAGLEATPLQRLRRRGLPLPAFAPLLPRAFGALDVGDVEVVLSSTSAFAHHVRAPAGAIHVAYCHTPPHFLWEPDGYFRGRERLRRILAPGLAVLKAADVAAARRVHAYVANSRYTARRIRDDYGIEATVIHPPVDTAAHAPSPRRSGRFLAVARLRRHKRLEVAVEAANRLRAPLDVIGDGPDEAFLRGLAGPTVRFLGHQPDAVVREAMASCAALLVPGVEDFGLTTAEVQAAGRPPVAAAGGGALEIIRDGVTGFLYVDPGVDGLAAAMARSQTEQLDPAALVASAERFARPAFDAALVAFLARAVARGVAAEGARAATERPAEAPPGAAASD